MRCVACAAVLATAVPGTSSADLALDISPAKYELQVPAGSARTIPITVTNGGDTVIHVQATLSDFTVGRDGNYDFLAPGKGPYSMADWISVNPREFDLQPKSFQQVRFSIAVPASIAGEYSSIVFFTTRPTRHPGGVAIAERVASKLYEIVPDTARFAGEIDDVTARTDGDAERYLVAFRNTGNAHVYLNGRVEVKKDGQTVARIPMAKDMLVERNGRRLIETSGQRLPPGQYNAIAFVDYGGPNLIAGQTSFTVR